MHLVDEKLTVFDATPGILQVQCTGADGFDFSAKELNPSLVFFFDKIVVINLPVFGYDFSTCVLQGTAPPPA